MSHHLFWLLVWWCLYGSNICSLCVCTGVPLEPHRSASLTTDDVMRDIRLKSKMNDPNTRTKIPFVEEPHEFTLSCRELKHKCQYNARGLIILKNDCYTSHDRAHNLKHKLFKPKKKGKKDLHLGGFHYCQYYTCRVFANECLKKAGGRYIKTLSCEHHTDHDTGLRYLLDMRCEYAQSCTQKKHNCRENSGGWSVKSNRCNEVIRINNATNTKYLEFADEECIYEEPKDWNFDDAQQQLLYYWQDFSVYQYSDGIDTFQTADAYID